MATASPGRIRVLAAAVANQLAAGEVVERPASAVKELVENAIDAGAKKIEIDIEKGGIGRIRVADDGCGIAKEDLPLALERHATSKIETAADLFEVLTLGFRGEALASLAAVARLTVTSRAEGEDTAWQVSDADREPRVVRGTPGTVVEAHELFYSVPARRRFLKTESTEAKHVTEVARRAAMACPGVEFELRHNGRRTFRARTGEHWIADLFSKQIAESAVPIGREGEHMHLKGWLGAGPKEEHILVVNGRTVRDRTAVHAVRTAVEGRWTQEGAPVSFVELTVDPGLVDVNAHPAKMEVRWRDTRAIHGLVASAVRAGVEGRLPVPAPHETRPRSSEPPQKSERAHKEVPPKEKTRSGAADTAAASQGGSSAPPPMSLGPRQTRPPRAGASVEPLSQGPTECVLVDETLAIAKVGTEVRLVDVTKGVEALVHEHAAMASETGTVRSSPVLVPATVPGDSVTAARLDELAQLGLVVREGLNGELRILEVPVVLKNVDPARWVTAVLETESAVDEALAKAARDHAVASPEAVRQILTCDGARAAATGPLDRERLREVAGLQTVPSVT